MQPLLIITSISRCLFNISTSSLYLLILLRGVPTSLPALVKTMISSTILILDETASWTRVEQCSQAEDWQMLDAWYVFII